MRIGISSGTGFGGTLNYDLDKDGRNDKEAEILEAEGVDVILDIDGKYKGDPQHIAQSFRLQAEMNPRVEKCVKHMYLSYMPQDIVAMVNNAVIRESAVDTVQQAIEMFGKEMVDQIVNQAMVADWKVVLKELGYENTQFLIVRHSEKSNPHSHCVLNMVDNDGKRIKDHREMKKGVSVCRDLTISRGYCWGDHKSVSQSKSERPYEIERQSMCKDIYGIIKGGTDAWTLKQEAAKKGITVRYRTDLTTGLIKGVSFERNGIRFQGGRLDRSLAATKILPIETQRPLTAHQRATLVTPEVEKLLKAGGVAVGVNNQKVLKPNPPLPPKYQMSKDIGVQHRVEVARKAKERKVSQDKPQKQEVQKSEAPKQQVKQSFKRSM